MSASDDEAEAPDEDFRGSLLAGCLALHEEVSIDYPLAVLSLPAASPVPALRTCAILISVTEDDRFIIALPGHVWHRQAQRRLLPANVVRRLTSLSVKVAALGDRSVSIAPPRTGIRAVPVLARGLRRGG